MWALKKLNLDWDAAANLRIEYLNELDVFWYHAYASSSLYKERMKYLHDKYIRNKEFKMKFKWSGPFEIVGVTPTAPVGQSEEPNIVVDTAETVRQMFTNPATPGLEDDKIQYETEVGATAGDIEMATKP
ncbi:uncharacterized protein [Nicotiana tomentosiformis]|uniref:uncharacterized protein n=1 Tax=Nicotiana tomentosiformis TaxID=4098 RepID=UPI00388C8656